MKWRIAGTATLVCTVFCAGTSKGESLQQALDRALAATSVTGEFLRRTLRDPYGKEGRERVEQAVRDFDGGLAAAAEQMTTKERDRAVSKAPDTIKDELAAIAVDRFLHRTIYDEIHVDCWPPSKPPFLVHRAPLPPRLRSEHVVEKYRLAWEYVLLKPSPAYWIRTTAAGALGTIGNPVSVIVLLHAAKVGANDEILGALAEMPSPAAANAALEVLDIAKERWPLASYQKDWVSVFLLHIGRLPPGKRSAWLEVMPDLERRSPAFGDVSRKLRAYLSIRRAAEATRVSRARVEDNTHDLRSVEEQLDQASRDLDASLTTAAEKMTSSERVAALAGDKIAISPNLDLSMEAKLGAIAADRANRPATYDEIRRTYLTRNESSATWIPLVARRMFSKVKYANETHRLAWELLILTPSPRDAAPGYDIAAAEALGAIGNPASATTLLYVFDMHTDQDIPLSDLTLSMQRLALDALAQMPSRVAAEAIATAIRHGESYMVGREGTWKPTAYVVDAIARTSWAKRAAWLAALREKPQNDGRIEALARPLLARLEAE